MAIRSAAKAIILHNDRILVNRCITENNEVYFDLPGGGQNQFETMEDAVTREVLEETGYKVRVIRFIALAEEICDNNELREKHFDYSHRIIHIFLAKLISEKTIEITEKDWQQEESLWMSLDEIDKVTFRPTQLSGRITDLVNVSHPQYLGCVRSN
ncbi:NUDIX domain-containing protein [Lachnoclostridium phytofermentans]|uniref:NUDIX hydrolase n=1 Tax=Lachnoclostridium phytofermentans (strain ATCC 700394 / DSM 18823 / ISDg) TaxID=357809 RepID=A9KR09_LACP7|nr:NUDIX domain-containing protein [Lachnoclostridium phytofermentans]ABX43488.1 NUDIX hydrolase [Lachnoclostridium phytofermentans ISDg]